MAKEKTAEGLPELVEGDSGHKYAGAQFIISAFSISQLPEPLFPEIAFAGRSNVGKSSLMNRLLGRRNLVKVSARPGKTQSLNYFLVDNSLYLVDLPGYGYAKVPQQMKRQWQELISAYLEGRRSLRCVVVIIDLRHEAKLQDREFVQWLRDRAVPFLLVYTKRDKLSRNEQQRQARQLDAAFLVQAQQRVLFSAKSGEGREDLIRQLEGYLEVAPSAPSPGVEKTSEP